MRRTIAGFLAVCALAVPLTIAVSGCGRLVETAWCLYTADRAYHNYRQHKIGWTVFEGLLAAHSCHQAFKRH